MQVHDHLVNHIQNPQLRSDNKLHVVGVMFNPQRWHRRLNLFRDWAEKMKATPGVELYLVEAAFQDQSFEVTEKENPNHLQIVAHQAIWIKENLVNLGVKYLLPRNWKYMSWCDADVTFLDNNWANEAMQQLQRFPVIQPWSDCIDMKFRGGTDRHFRSFCYMLASGKKFQRQPDEPYEYAHSGFAWACTRGFWEATQGLMERCIVGSADHHMAWGMINELSASVHGKMPEAYKRMCSDWANAAFRVTHGKMGFVPGTIVHHFHGRKEKRGYRERWNIFIDHAFDPYKDLSFDSQGLAYIVNKPLLVHECGEYLNSRCEDEIGE